MLTPPGLKLGSVWEGRRLQTYVTTTVTTRLSIAARAGPGVVVFVFLLPLSPFQIAFAYCDATTRMTFCIPRLSVLRGVNSVRDRFSCVAGVIVSTVFLFSVFLGVFILWTDFCVCVVLLCP